MNECIITAAKRSPSGRIPGELSQIGEIDLLSQVFRAVAADKLVEEALTGCSFPIERDNLCRKAVLAAELPTDIHAATISKTCASSDEALRIGYERILLGSSRCVLVGGIEKISNSPHVLRVMKQNVKRQLHAKTLFRQEALEQLQENDMAYLAEQAAYQNRITRRQQDDFTLRSIKKAIRADRQGRFREEIAEIQTSAEGVSLSKDELLQWERTEDEIRRAPPMFLRDGSLTKYNAAAVCDCAVGVLLMEKQTALAQGMAPLAAIRSVVTAGTDRLGACMQQCIHKLLQANGLSQRDVALYEVNESFAAQAIWAIQECGLEPERVNVNGGNLALGYPIGATGLRMLTTLSHEMKRRAARFGVSVMCAGGAMAQAMLLENVL